MAEPTKTLKDAAYVVIGLGVIATQKVNVRRQELRKQLETQRKQLETQAATARELVEAQAADARSQLLKLAEGIEQRIEPLVDQVEERLPAQAAKLFKDARGQAKEARDTAKARLAPAAA
jgi:uncharacterized membrane-anchored protein YhcB (DUF1043 family)